MKKIVVMAFNARADGGYPQIRTNTTRNRYGDHASSVRPKPCDLIATVAACSPAITNLSFGCQTLKSTTRPRMAVKAAMMSTSCPWSLQDSGPCGQYFAAP